MGYSTFNAFRHLTSHLALLSVSLQDDFIFSVSFRRYGRSLHARVEQWNHQFSFDAHDSGVFKNSTVTGLIGKLLQCAGYYR